MKKIIISLILLSLVLIACNVEDNSIKCPEGSKDADACITLYDPVCSNDKTYSNSCKACQVEDSYLEGECLN